MDSFIKYLTKMKVSINKFEDSFRIMKLIAYYLIASVSTKIKRYQYTFEVKKKFITYSYLVIWT